MEDSENGGKGEMQERNRTVVSPREKVEREGFTTGRQFSRFSIQFESLCFCEISCQSIFATFPSPHFPHAAATLPQHGIDQFHALCI